MQPPPSIGASLIVGPTIKNRMEAILAFLYVQFLYVQFLSITL